MNAPFVWIIGNRGMLGQELSQAIEKQGIPAVGSDLEVSILDLEALNAFARNNLPPFGNRSGRTADPTSSLSSIFNTTSAGITSPGRSDESLSSLPINWNVKEQPSGLTSQNLPTDWERNRAPRRVDGTEPSSTQSPRLWIVNCAAYTAVDKAEDEPDQCFALNAEGPRNIARVAEELGAGLLHISTDYVFDGKGIRDASGNLRPYREEDPVGPVGVYARSKAEGETAVLHTCSRAVILRTAWLYGKYGNNFVFTMLRLMKERDMVRVVADQRGTPTWAVDLARAILTVFRAPTHTYGIYHFTNGGECTWYEFACEIHRLGRRYGLLPRDCRVEPISTDQYPTKARRPAYSVLSKEKIQKVYGVSVPAWQESLEKFLKNL